MQLQSVLEEMDCLDAFRPSLGGRIAFLLILLAPSATFSTINHGILLERLTGLGVGGSMLQWLHSYFTNLFQKMVLGDSC